MVSKDNKDIAKYVAARFGGKPHIHQYYDDNGDKIIPILNVTGCPFDSISSYSTIGLSDFPLYLNGQEYDVRIELLGVSRTVSEAYANMLSSCAFNIIRKQ